MEGDGENGNAPLSISEVKEAITKYVSQTKKKKVDFAFEEDWQTYPNKAGKEQARKKYNSSVGKDLLENRPEFQKAIKNYLSFVDHERNNGFPNRRHKDGSTFFNEWKGWVDYKTPEEAPVEDTEKELEVSL